VPASNLKASITHITSTTPLTPAINAWRFYLEDQGKSPHTIKAFLADVSMLANYLPPDRPLGNVSTHEINSFLTWMEKSRGVPCSPKTYARRITSIKSFFRWLHQYGVIIVDPAERVVQQSVISPLPQVLTPEEIEAVIKVADGYRHRTSPDTRYFTLVTLLLETGIKKSECLSLSPNHVDLENPAEPFLFIRYASPQHRYKERKIPVSDTWVQAYHDYCLQYKPTDRLFPWSQRRLEYLLEDLGVEAGLEKHLSFDMCRWTCALTDWYAEMDHNKIRQKLGISKIQWREVKMKLTQLAGDTA
jgi:integrase/recombinase XerD